MADKFGNFDDVAHAMIAGGIAGALASHAAGFAHFGIEVLGPSVDGRGLYENAIVLARDGEPAYRVVVEKIE